MSSPDLALAEEACREKLTYLEDPFELPVALSERRGDVVALLFHRENPETDASCVIDLPEGAGRAGEVQVGMAGSDGPANKAAPNAVLRGSIAQSTLGGQTLTVVSGSVGPGVKSVTLRAGATEAVATITAGRYAGWIPGPVFASSDEPNGEGGPEAILAYDLVLDDGTVIMDADPSLRE